MAYFNSENITRAIISSYGKKWLPQWDKWRGRSLEKRIWMNDCEYIALNQKTLLKNVSGSIDNAEAK